jgi:hypothetical protein
METPSPTNIKEEIDKSKTFPTQKDDQDESETDDSECSENSQNQLETIETANSYPMIVPKKKRKTETRLPAHKNQAVLKRLASFLSEPGLHDSRYIMRQRVIKYYRQESISNAINRFTLSNSGQCDDPDFKAINHFLDSSMADKMCRMANHSIPLALRTIAILEEHPEPIEVGGVDFSLLYVNLANFMMGLPMAPMNEQTSAVLNEVYRITANESRSMDECNEKAQIMFDVLSQNSLAKAAKEGIFE